MNVVFGHFCMMPMVYAAVPHDDQMEMVMTPMVPMSPAHCEHCASITKQEPPPMSATCAGHCLSKANDVIGIITTTQSMLSQLALPSSLPVVVASADTGQSFIEANAPPAPSPPTRTVVLLE